MAQTDSSAEPPRAVRFGANFADEGSGQVVATIRKKHPETAIVKAKSAKKSIAIERYNARYYIYV